MKIGLLTGGGDSPATNAAIRAVVKRAERDGHEIIGIKKGWAGVINKEAEKLTRDNVSGIINKGGTILGTSRTNPFKMDNGIELAIDGVKSLGIDAICAIGGDDTLGVAHKLNNLENPIHAVGIPQTIDNDIAGTDYAIGFDSALAIATDAIDKLHTTAESHRRVMIVEVMGRDAGHIALEAGLAGGADVILVPDEDFDVKEVGERIKKRTDRGKTFSIVVVAEGAKPIGVEDQVVKSGKKDMFGHVMLGGIGEYLNKELADLTHLETRVTNLGHLQRGGAPTPFDRLVATRFGLRIVEMINEGKWDYMVCLKGGKVTEIPLEDALKTKPVDLDLLELSKVFY